MDSHKKNIELLTLARNIVATDTDQCRRMLSQSVKTLQLKKPKGVLMIPPETEQVTAAPSRQPQSPRKEPSQVAASNAKVVNPETELQNGSASPDVEPLVDNAQKQVIQNESAETQCSVSSASSHSVAKPAGSAAVSVDNKAPSDAVVSTVSTKETIAELQPSSPITSTTSRAGSAKAASALDIDKKLGTATAARAKSESQPSQRVSARRTNNREPSQLAGKDSARQVSEQTATISLPSVNSGYDRSPVTASTPHLSPALKLRLLQDNDCIPIPSPLQPGSPYRAPIRAVREYTPQKTLGKQPALQKLDANASPKKASPKARSPLRHEVSIEPPRNSSLASKSLAADRPPKISTVMSSQATMSLFERLQRPTAASAARTRAYKHAASPLQRPTKAIRPLASTGPSQLGQTASATSLLPKLRPPQSMLLPIQPRMAARQTSNTQLRPPKPPASRPSSTSTSKSVSTSTRGLPPKIAAPRTGHIFGYSSATSKLSSQPGTSTINGSSSTRPGSTRPGSVRPAVEMKSSGKQASGIYPPAAIKPRLPPIGQTTVSVLKASTAAAPIVPRLKEPNKDEVLLTPTRNTSSLELTQVLVQAETPSLPDISRVDDTSSLILEWAASDNVRAIVLDQNNREIRKMFGRMPEIRIEEVFADARKAYREAKASQRQAQA